MPSPAFTYSGPSVGAAFTAGVFNLSWDLAAAKSVDALTRTDAAIALASTAPTIAATPTVGVTLPTAPTAPTPLDQTAALSLFETAKNEVVTLLTSSFDTFLTTYFPVGSELAAAQTWLADAISTGGSGINAAVEDQIWERDRSRVLKDSGRVQEELISTWASRRFPLPPGAAAYQLLQAQKDAADKIAESSRGTAIKVFDTEIENVRFAVDKAISLRQIAVSAAGDFIRAIALGPQVGAQLMSSIVDAQAKMTGAVSEFYRAQISAAETKLRADTSTAEFDVRAKEANLRAAIEALSQRVSTAIAAAQMLATQAAASLNALHAAAGISGSESL